MARSKAAVKATKHPDVLLAERYADRGWALFTEVRSTISMHKVHTRADALAFSLWEGRGLELHGHEVKISRSDLLRELKEPHKAEGVQQFCDRWWLVLSDKALIQDGELPPTWGLLAPRNGSLHPFVKAPKLEAKPWTRGFICGLMRQLGETTVSRKLLTAMTQEHHGKVSAAAHEQAEVIATRLVEQRTRDLRSTVSELEGLRSAVATFEHRTGIKITTYGYPSGNHSAEVGKLATQLVGTDLGQLASNLERAAAAARLAADATAKVPKQLGMNARIAEREADNAMQEGAGADGQQPEGEG